jgi:hypothetical protein
MSSDFERSEAVKTPARTGATVVRRLPRWLGLALLLLAGAIVLREPVAQAAQLVDAKIIGPLDGNGDVSVHEQGTAAVREQNLDRAGSIRVHEHGTAAVNVTNSSITVDQAGTPVAIRLIWPDDDTYTVPTGKRLRVHYVNGFSTKDPIAVHVLAGGTFLQTYRFLGATAFTNPSGEVLRVISEPVLIQAEQGQHLQVSADADVELSGYLVDA